ncbi:GAF domain-containing protein [Oscillatoria amoena NRMC-F 0135]|nr:GAF domain-containing protein [Oscillatoria amoena NRMC-F 0135]
MKVFRHWSTAHRNTLVLTGCGLIGIALVALVGRLIRSDYNQSTAYQNLVSRCEVWIIQSHLHYQRVASGDYTIDFAKEVLSPLRSSVTRLEVAYAGGQSGTDYFPKPDEDTQALIKMMLYDVQEVSNLISQQKQAGAFTTAEADGAFEKASRSLGKLAEHLSGHSNASQQNTQFISTIILLVLIGAVTLGGILYFRFHRNSEKRIHSANIKLHEETNRVETLSRFIEAISNADYSIALEAEDKSGLTARLMAMRDKLKANAEDDARRSWASQGIAQIGEILRDTENSGLLYDKLIKFVVNYTGCNQGGLFLLNDDDEQHPVLELLAAYAFERKKFITKRLEIGQGMVGQCYLEADRIFLAKLPEEYVHITSGLGGANPTCLLLVPLMANEKVYGVFELASFKRLEEHEMQLIEKFAENIASTVSTVKGNESTRLLLERTQQQAEEMRAQEEEMRQNMEELSATQEEMARKEREYIKRIQELEEQVQTRATTG